MSTTSHYQQCRILRFGVCVVILALAAYIGWLQLAENEEMNHWSERQQKRLNYVPGKRGSILDRNGTPLNYDIATYSIAIHIERLRDPRDTRTATLNKVSTTVAELASLLGPDAYHSRPTTNDILRHVVQTAPLPFVLWKNPSDEMLANFALYRHRFPAADLVLTWKRVYDHETAATQIRGYGAEDKPSDDDTAKRLFNFKEYIGKTGIEQACNETLRGTNGYQLFQTDVFTYRHETVETKKAVPGQDVALTIDIKLQEFTEEIYRNRDLRGSVVVMDAQNGEIIIMTSIPSHHLPVRREDIDNKGAMRNNALAGYYPPGSTIKPLIALAALQQGVIGPNDYLDCPGYYQLNPQHKVGCTAKYGHGSLTLVPALAYSCNTYFCVLGSRLDYSHVTDLASEIGLGRPLHTILWRSEKSGIAFTPEWVHSKRKIDSGWHPGDAANAAIGQGEWIVTPLQMAVYACAITTGRIYTPKFVISTDDALVNTIDWPDEIWKPVKEGLLECVISPKGTGKALRIRGIDVLGKTGTAEHGKNLTPHAWTFAALPADNPRFVGVCVVEEGGGGGKVAAPILHDVLVQVVETYLPTTFPEGE
ncbi:MAG: hypothetical protein K5787_18105 [Lentisphaeria bacterium]|nr:hypothetical protein [Lentisphaeria bacterium]